MRSRMVRVGSVEIDLCPVTWGAFARFVEAGGYGDRGLWSPEGWVWRSATNTARPRFFLEPKWAHLTSAERPVCGVSWWEAEAFARWANKRLPTEAEWEAACGPARFPWGDTWREEACAHRGANGPRAAPRVGSFPQGASPCGALDLVGSVWQWCDGWYDAARAIRVARGGAWNTPPEQCACAARNGWPAGARFSNLGFRCAR